MKWILPVLFLVGCSGSPERRKIIITPWTETVSCPAGEVMYSAKTFFWMNGDLKGYEIECGPGACK